jgi:preprotein translocase subunit SecG
MLTFFSIVHVGLCVFMIFVILLQPGKDAGMGAALGGGAATSAFGGRGAVTFLGKVTAVCAIAFFLTSLGLSFVGLKSSVASSVTETAAPAAPAPAAPAPTEGQGAMETAPAEQPAAPSDKDVKIPGVPSTTPPSPNPPAGQ